MDHNIFNISYAKNYGCNQMILTPTAQLMPTKEQLDNNFRIQMIHENNIPGLLNTHIYYADATPSFCYDINGLQSLKIVLESTPLTYVLLTKILVGMYNAFMELENYMLKYEHLLTDLEYIYISSDYSNVYLCYYPIYEHNFSHSIKNIFDQLLKTVDHHDEKCVFLAYTLHKECMSPDFSSTQLLTSLSTLSSKYDIANLDQHSSDYCHTSTNDIKPHTEPANHIKDSNHTTALHDTVKSTFIQDNKSLVLKMSVLASITLLSVITITTMFALGVFSMTIFLILFAIIAIICAYNGYMIYYLNAPSKLSSVIATKDLTTQPIYSQTDKFVSPSTCLLSPINEDSIYKLIYTGNDNRQDIPMTTFPFVIGKGDVCDGQLPDLTVSRIHARFDQIANELGNPTLYIEDLNSTNGTQVNTTPLAPYSKTHLSIGDMISFGGVTYLLR